MGGEEGEGVTDLGGEVVARPNRVGVDARVLVVAQHELGERSGVAADRRVGLGGARLERPTRVCGGTSPILRKEPRLHRADRTAPASGRRFREALAVALSRADT